jgi:hypothetical protein
MLKAPWCGAALQCCGFAMARGSEAVRIESYVVAFRPQSLAARITLEDVDWQRLNFLVGTEAYHAPGGTSGRSSLGKFWRKTARTDFSESTQSAAPTRAQTSRP